MVALGSKP